MVSSRILYFFPAAQRIYTMRTPRDVVKWWGKDLFYSGTSTRVGEHCSRRFQLIEVRCPARSSCLRSRPASSLDVVVFRGASDLMEDFTSNWQGELFTQYSMSSVQMMCGVNLFSCLFTTVSLLQQGGFYHSLNFMIQFPKFMLDCVILSLCSACGQLFIFYTIATFGPVVFVIIMTIRQLLAILLSCLIYHHYISAMGIAGVIIVFVAVFLRIYCNQRLKAIKGRRSMAQVGSGKV
uniref:Adenosine 3'-phospho 5'-phosphosulfate transporter 1 n=1 Tax=Timema douglasi TaxID=61478 RepID=A0A7R8VL83_TIMDO|nr:unnamed protein product [Timema douglasi]